MLQRFIKNTNILTLTIPVSGKEKKKHEEYYLRAELFV